ncbi:MAG TPA: cytochrome c3 family protein [Candidatus Krumholzibacteria bacterium]|nr:cytochrome c3 family protein [Candidatus Krumholzibacteria bacterium]
MGHTRRNTIFALLTTLGLAFTLALFQSAQSSETEPISNAVCLDCHEDAAHSMLGTAHDPVGGKVSCVGCHAGPATAMHVEDPDTYKPVNPASVPADSVTALCTTCHVGAHPLNLNERDPHADANLSCTGCHEVHGNEHLSLLKDDENQLCLGCHQSARASFALPTHHPVEEGVVACRDCHISIAQSKKQRTAGGPSNTCVTCHGEFQGPFPYEHEAAVDYSVNEGGCLNCHNPHGSTFPMLLKQSYEAPHYSLCSQCHSVPKHLNNTQHGTQWSGVPCSDCHSDVHGSYVNRNLLDSSLQTQGCFLGGSGCHQM